MRIGHWDRDKISWVDCHHGKNHSCIESTSNSILRSHAQPKLESLRLFFQRRCDIISNLTNFHIFCFSVLLLFHSILLFLFCFLIFLVVYLFLFTEKSITDFTSHFFSNGFTIFTVLKPLNSIYNFCCSKVSHFFLFFNFLKYGEEENGFILNDIILKVTQCYNFDSIPKYFCITQNAIIW